MPRSPAISKQAWRTWPHWGDVGVLALITLVATALLAPVLFTSDVLAPRGVYHLSPWKAQAPAEQPPQYPGWDDFVLSHLPRRYLAARALRDGVFPLWNPYSFGGMPLLADPQYGLFYPPNLLFLLFPVNQAYDWAVWLHLIMTAGFTYALLRKLGCRRVSALVGGLALAFSGHSLGLLYSYPNLTTCTWIPALFWGLEILLTKRRPLSAVPLTLSVMLMIFAGKPPFYVYSLYALAAYAAVRLVAITRREGTRQGLSIATSVALAVMIGILLAAIQLLPTYELSRYSDRSNLDITGDNKGWRALLPLITTMVPYFFGHVIRMPRALDLAMQILPPTLKRLPRLYMGGMTIVAAGLALPSVRRDHRTLGFTLITLGPWIIVLSEGTIIRTVFMLLPGIRISPVNRILVLFAFGASVLAGLGVDHVLGKKADQRPLTKLTIALLAISLVAVTAAVGWQIAAQTGRLDRLTVQFTEVLRNRPALAQKELAILTAVVAQWFSYVGGQVLVAAGLLTAALGLWLLYLRDKINWQVAGWLTAAILLLDLSWVYVSALTPQPAESFYPPTEGISALLADPEPFRIVRFRSDTLPMSTPSVYGIQDTQGYNALNLNTYRRKFWGLLKSRQGDLRAIHAIQSPSELLSPLLDMLNVKYVLAEPDQRRVPANGLTLAYDGPDMLIYRRENTLPRAFVVFDYQIATNSADMLSALQAPDFDPRRIVILDQDPKIALPSGEEGLATAEVVDYGFNHVVIQVDTSHDGILVLGDVYYPGWQVRVDGAKRPLLQANYILRGVAVGAGTHQVAFSYSPVSFWGGLGISVVTLLVGVAALIVYQRRPAKRPTKGK